MPVHQHHLTRLFDDPYLTNYLPVIRSRLDKAKHTEHRLTQGKMSLHDFASAHEYYGLHVRNGKWIFREWAPNATSIALVGDFSQWRESRDFELTRINDAGAWEITLPRDAMRHGDLFKLKMRWHGGSAERIPAYARRVVQDEHTKVFSAQIWQPENPYKWKHKRRSGEFEAPLIYETHVGMAQEREGVGTYDEFRRLMLPRIITAGYNTIQLMAIMEHPYYGSFGYHVSNFFAASSRFGTPEELKALIDEAHAMGLTVIMDLIHSHSVNNEIEGLGRFDGTLHQYFHAGDRGRHVAWDSRCFDYGKTEVLHFLLSNCRYWLDEFNFDGYRFDGITSMVYHDHGLGPGFTSYDRYFDNSVDEDALAYLWMANKVIHSVRPDAITIAEDVSGMPGLATPIKDGGYGFDYRLAMGIPDAWFKLIDETKDEDWNMDYLWHELTNHRQDERTVSYAESHDQALVGGKTVIFEMIDAAMYQFMRVTDNNLDVERGIALHKMIRLITLASASDAYLNFMGNEFGHPEWIDFPRDGNNWSYKHARRQWRLRDDKSLKYHFLADFDRGMIRLAREGHIVGVTPPRRLFAHSLDKIVCFERRGLFFFFNFHPHQSVKDYGVEVPPGEYELVMDTDEARFGGQGRITAGQRYFTTAVRDRNMARNFIKFYLPCRTAMVLRRVMPGKQRGGSGSRRTER